MALSVTTVATTERLTTRARITEAIPGTVAGDAAFLDSLIDRASAAIKSYCHRPFAREAYTETLPGYGGIRLQLARTPIVGSPSSVSLDTTLITDYSVESPERGWLYRQRGWSWTAQIYEGLTGNLDWLDRGFPLPRQEEPRYSVSYTAGFILPPQNVIGNTGISVDAADDSFNSTALFPALLKAGDVIETLDFATPANNGRFVVTGTPTTSKVQVSAALTTEAAGASASIIFQSLPYDVEAAAIECVKTWFATRGTASNIVEKSVGPMRVRYSETGAEVLALPPACVGLLRPWVRAA